MQIEVFKTDVITTEHADMVIDLVKSIIPVHRINFDLKDCDNILRIEAKVIQVEPILNLLHSLGFKCIPLK